MRVLVTTTLTHNEWSNVFARNCKLIPVSRSKTFGQARRLSDSFVSNSLFTDLLFSPQKLSSALMKIKRMGDSLTASIKPGSQCRRSTCYMTPTGLPVLPAIPFRYENRSRRQQTLWQSLPPGMLAKLTRVRLRRHTGGKDLRCFLSRRRYVLICPSSIAGSARGYFALRRHMRTKLKGPEVVFLRTLL